MIKSCGKKQIKNEPVQFLDGQTPKKMADIVCIYPNPLPWTGCDTRSIFKQD